MDIIITPSELKFALGVHSEQIVYQLTDTSIEGHISRIISEVTVGIPDNFPNVELIRSIALSYLKYFFWSRMNSKDVPEHIREERRAYEKLLSQIRQGEFRESVAEPYFRCKGRYFGVNL